MKGLFLRLAAVILLMASMPFGGAWAQATPKKAPEQADVTVKIVEFQTSKGSETGLSAYFRNTAAHLGKVITSDGVISNADLTFPSGTAAGITVFLDRLGLSESDVELVLQGLVNENRAFILSNPRTMVPVGSGRAPADKGKDGKVKGPKYPPTVIKTAQLIPYEKTVVVGSTAVQTTAFRETGVALEVGLDRIYDYDGDYSTVHDTYLKLHLTATVKEEGQRIVIALDDQLAGGVWSLANNAISVPEFISRSIETTIWVRHGQVLVLGGLYRDTKNKTLASLPWLTQTEEAVTGALNKILPGMKLRTPLSSILGNRAKQNSRRELVFLIKAEAWYPDPSLSIVLEESLGDGDSAEPAQGDAP